MGITKTVPYGNTALSDDGMYVAGLYECTLAGGRDVYTVQCWRLGDDGSVGTPYLLAKHNRPVSGFSTHGHELMYMLDDRIRILDMRKPAHEDNRVRLIWVNVEFLGMWIIRSGSRPHCPALML